jgi:hypothetical protein
MDKAMQCSWCRETFVEEHFEGAEILLNRTGVVTVLIKGRLHKFNTNKSKMEKEENEEAGSECEQVCSDESKTRVEKDLSAEGDEI